MFIMTVRDTVNDKNILFGCLITPHELNLIHSKYPMDIISFNVYKIHLVFLDAIFNYLILLMLQLLMTEYRSV